jgi:hypothetical protein
MRPSHLQEVRLVHDIIPINLFPLRPLDADTLAADPRCSAPGVFVIVAAGAEPRWAFVGKADVSIAESIRALGQGRGPLAALVREGGAFVPVVMRNPEWREAAAAHLRREFAPLHNAPDVPESKQPCVIQFHGSAAGRPAYLPGAGGGQGRAA